MTVVHATITGSPVLGVANHDDSPPGSLVPTAFTAVVSSVKVIAGTDHVAPLATGCDGGVCAYSPAFFAIDFNPVTFSGAQFYLYMSQNGFANVNTTAGDVRYAGPFSASDLAGAGAYQVQGIGGGISGASYWIGTAGGFKLIVGPIPVQVSTAYKYIKVYDGSCGSNPTFCGGTGIAGAIQQVLVQPGIVIDVKNGPAWTPVHVSGGGFAAGQHVDINASFAHQTWAGVITAVDTGTAFGISTGAGFFGPVLFSMIDVKQVINPPICCANPIFITLTAVNSSQGPPDEDDVALNAAQNSAFPVMFNEFLRYFNQVSSYFSGATILVTPYGTYGNGTAAPGTPPFVPSQPIPVYITGTMGIVGSNFTVGGSVSVWINGIQLAGSPVTTSTSGHWVGNFTIPKLASGVYEVSVLNNGVTYQFKVMVLPTLILTPNSGPGGTVVTATAYGFPGNSWVSLWWFETSFETGSDSFLLNSTVDSTGSYNHTITFVVPISYGGAHDVSATTTSWVSPTADAGLEAGVGFVTEATFTVTPTLKITPTSSPDNATALWVTGTGFIPADSTTGCAENCIYGVNIDHSFYTLFDGAGARPAEGIGAQNNGSLKFEVIAAGFRPGLHIVELMGPGPACPEGSECESPANVGKPAAWVTFTITTTGDPIADSITALSTSINGLATTLTSVSSQLTAIQGSLTSVQSSLTTIQSMLTTITNDVSGLAGQLTTISTAVTALQNAITSATTGLAKTSDVTSAVSTLQSSISSATSGLAKSSDVTNAVSQIQSAISSATSGLAKSTDVSGAVNTLAGDISAAQSSINSGTSTAQTYVLVVAVLAAITLVLELAILVRKLS